MTDETENEIYASYEMENGVEVRKILPNDTVYLKEMRKQYEEYLTNTEKTI
ncbi:MAG: hypothetical protein ACOYMZ_01140 [Minisyncoccia bacterium]